MDRKRIDDFVLSVAAVGREVLLEVVVQIFSQLPFAARLLGQGLEIELVAACIFVEPDLTETNGGGFFGQLAEQIGGEFFLADV